MPLLKYSTFSFYSLVPLLLLFLLPACESAVTSVKKKKLHSHVDWPAYGGNKYGNRYSPLKQINLGNVKNLQSVWSYNSESNDSGITVHLKNSQIQCQPIVVDGILYGTSPKLKLFALEAGSGQKIWEFDPFKNGKPQYTSCRGLAYWENGGDKRLLYTAGSSLFAIDTNSGLPVKSFGVDGHVDLHTGLDNHHEVKDLFVAATSPGVVYNNILIIGSALSEGGDAAPGYVRGFDIITGELKWVFHTIPEPGEFGYETWPKDAYKKIGAVNNWSGMTVDEKRGAVYFGTGSPASDFYGGDRKGTNLFADCIIALDASTGTLKWYYQTIHHDLWDRDIPCPPNLATIVHDGKKTDVVVQATKDGLIYVLNRDSGTSIFPVEERKVPVDGLPGEHPWPTQKYPVKPMPFSNQVFEESDITNLSDESHAFIKMIYDSTNHSNKFLPPGKKPTILYGYSGGAEWGGNAIDSEGILYQNANNAIWEVEMESALDHAKTMKLPYGERLFLNFCASCHGSDRKGNGVEIPSLLQLEKRYDDSTVNNILLEGRGRMPSFRQLEPYEREGLIHFLLNSNMPEQGKINRSQDHMKTAQKTNGDFPYHPPYQVKTWVRVYDQKGYPAMKPPWGTLNAIDLNTGEYLWRVPLGEFAELTKKGIPPTGTENYGGPLVTDGGLVFIAATRDEKIRAFNKKTGKVVWEYKLPAAGFATPITYEVNGRQFIVIAAGGGRGLKSGTSYIAFALPENSN